MNRLKQLSLWGVYALLAYMPLHIFLSQSLSVQTGNLNAWKVAKDVFAMVLLALVFTLVVAYRKHKNTQYLLFAGLAALYLVLHGLLYLANKDTSAGVASLATVYNNRLFWFFGIGMGVALLWGKKLDPTKVIKLVLIVSTVVSLFGVAQYFLPKDILTHVGYSIERGVKPMFFIDDKPDLPRIMSTLRDPNSLGSYLLLPIAFLTYYWLKRPKRRVLIGGLLLLHGLALVLTFSRSAWLAVMVSQTILLASMYGRSYVRVIRKHLPVVLVSLAVLFAGVYALRDQYFVQNVIVHSDENTQQAGSTDLHAQLAIEGLRGVADEPTGHGPGTAGIVSVHDDEVVIPENYYIQIAYEVGILGLLIFVTAQVLIYRELMRDKRPLALALIATFWGYVLTNMLLQIWANEAVAAQWWLLAGVGVGMQTRGGIITNKKLSRSK